MRRQIIPAVTAVLVFTLLLGVLYPLVVTGIAQFAFGHRADGSLVRRDGVVVGSSLLGQGFTADRYFWPRPSAGGYDGVASGGTGAGPTNPTFLATVAERAAAYRAANGLPTELPVPVDAVTASGSGLDPHISVRNARLQAARVAAARDLPTAAVLALVDQHTAEPAFGFLGQRAVNVLELNLALDAVG